MIDDHDRNESVNVSSGTGSPGLSQPKSREPLNGCVVVCVCVVFGSDLMSTWNQRRVVSH